MVSRVRISENGKSVLYEKRYHGILTENGCVRLKAYCAKRIPLGTAGTAKSSPQAEENMKGAARAVRQEGKELYLFLALFYINDRRNCHVYKITDEQYAAAGRAA